jgi:hypothetical protein
VAALQRSVVCGVSFLNRLLGGAGDPDAVARSAGDQFERAERLGQVCFGEGSCGLGLGQFAGQLAMLGFQAMIVRAKNRLIIHNIPFK